MKLVPRRYSKGPDWVAGDVTTFPLESRRVVAFWMLVLSYTFNVVGGTGAGTLFTDPQGRALRKLIFYGNGRPLQTYSGQFLVLYTLYYLKQPFTQIPPSALAAGTVQAAREAVLRLPAMMDHSYSSDATGVPPIKDPYFEFYWGTGRDLVKTPDGAVSMTAGAVRLTEWSFDEPKIPAGGFAPNMITQKEVIVPASGQVPIELDMLNPERAGAPGRELRALFIEALIDGAAGSPSQDFTYSDALITSIDSLEIAGVERYKVSVWRDQQQVNKADYGLAALQAGCAVIDAGADKRTERGELWTHSGDTKAQLLVTAAVQGAGVNKIRVTALYTAR